MVVYDKNFVYFLGFIWADGYIDRTRTVLEIVEEDAINIVDDIKKISFLKICTMRRRRKNRKPQMSIYFCNSKFHDEFISKYYLNKSKESPILLINDIPEDLRRYFYLGLIDGDGCFYFNKSTRQFYVTSSYDQDWSHMEQLFLYLDIKQYEIRRIINKNGNKSSYIRVKKQNEIESLFEYLYPNGYEIGLSRKYIKCKSIVDNKPKNSANKSKIDIDLLKSKINDGLGIIDVSKHFECSCSKIYNCCKRNNIKYKSGFLTGTYKPKPKREKTNKFMSFDRSREVIVGLKLKNQKEWNVYSRTNRPDDIPSNPRIIYKDYGWVSFTNWIGN